MLGATLMHQLSSSSLPPTLLVVSTSTTAAGIRVPTNCACRTASAVAGLAVVSLGFCMQHTCSTLIAFSRRRLLLSESPDNRASL